MLVTELGIIMDFKFSHSEKAYSPMLLMELGSDIEVNAGKDEKPRSPIAIIPYFTSIFVVVFLISLNQ